MPDATWMPERLRRRHIRGVRILFGRWWPRRGIALEYEDGTLRARGAVSAATLERLRQYARQHKAKVGYRGGHYWIDNMERKK